MKNPESWAFPAELQPKPAELSFDLPAALDSLVLLRAEIPEDAFTANILGTERNGNGVVIRDDGLVLTIGYLITEASTIWLHTNAAPWLALPARLRPGDGLRRAAARPPRQPAPRRHGGIMWVGDDVIIAGMAARLMRCKQILLPSASSPAIGNTCR
jgi:hypothetical protein